jgi:hypothetical protein
VGYIIQTLSNGLFRISVSGDVELSLICCRLLGHRASFLHSLYCPFFAGALRLTGFDGAAGGCASMSLRRMTAAAAEY